jgi:hypothetical protein
LATEATVIMLSFKLKSLWSRAGTFTWKS